MTRHLILFGFTPARQAALASDLHQLGLDSPRHAHGSLVVQWQPRHEAQRGELFNGLRELATDFAVLPPGLALADFRLLACDMDSTLIEVETIVALADLVGATEEVGRLTERAISDARDDYAASMRYRIGLLRGLAVADLHRLIERTVRLSPGAAELIAMAARAGLRTAIVSGGFDLVAQGIRQRLGMDEAFAHKLEVVDGRLSGTLLGEVIDAPGKAAIVQQLCARHGIAPQQVIAVGDGANDLDMARQAGLFVGFRPKPVLLPACDIVLDHGGLDSLSTVLAQGRQVEGLRAEAVQ
ncbi:MAG: phosphoserine phosphatase SerB [Pseudomonas piscis]|uniref:phosphoserine phosphatase SerB n=1 Tax=Pseudomonas piscis TaxID=2614538 RepID=UPI003D287784